MARKKKAAKKKTAPKKKRSPRGGKAKPAGSAAATAALFEAIAARDLAGVRSALAKGADLDGRSERGRKPFFNAAGFEDREIMKALLEAGADPTDRLVAALMRRNAEVAKFLDEQGADVNARLTESGQTLLHAACDCALPELVRYSVREKHLDLDLRTDDGTTARQIAGRLGLDLGDLA
jgi:ankyrin repeat protein